MPERGAEMGVSVEPRSRRALLGAGLILGVALWAKWGFAIAFEAIRTYCF